MYSNLDIAITFLYILLLLNVLFAALVYGVKLRRLARARAQQRFEERARDYRSYILVHMEGEEPLLAPPFTMNRAEQEAMQAWLNDMIEGLSGIPRERCIELCRRMGRADHYLDRLRTGSYGARLDAAYHLGCMRVQEAVPPLLQLLRSHPRNSAFFVIARAIAKCARSKQDIHEMVQIALKHNKGFYELLVDMVKEADIDHGALFAEYIQREDKALIQIGLCGLKAASEPRAASAVYRLLDSSDSAISALAAAIYLRSVHFIPRHAVHKLLRHPLEEIRLLAAEGIADLKLVSYAEALRQGVGDDSRRVAYASASGLLRLGEQGIIQLCAAAVDASGTTRGDELNQWIQDELRSLSGLQHDLEQLSRYNSLAYHYGKAAGVKQPIYRVV